VTKDRASCLCVFSVAHNFKHRSQALCCRLRRPQRLRRHSHSLPTFGTCTSLIQGLNAIPRHFSTGVSSLQTATRVATHQPSSLLSSCFAQSRIHHLEQKVYNWHISYHSQAPICFLLYSLSTSATTTPIFALCSLVKIISSWTCLATSSHILRLQSARSERSSLVFSPQRRSKPIRSPKSNFQRLWTKLAIRQRWEGSQILAWGRLTGITSARPVAKGWPNVQVISVTSN